MGYQDLREYLTALESHDLLHRVAKEVDKDWEVAAVCRRVFQRFSPSRRKALLFERVRGFAVPVAAGIVGASRRVYALALETDENGIAEKWDTAMRRPIAPELVPTGPVQEMVWLGEQADVTRIPVPTWTVEHDAAPFMTASFVVTRDPDTGWTNVGTYRAQLKGPRRVGIAIGRAHHGLIHFDKYASRGERCPAAIVLGTDPSIALVSVAAIPQNVDELAVAGGLRGEPVPLVRCQTVDLQVPASAEYVIEGYMPPEKEMEGPFGEYAGYMGLAEPNCVLEVTCVTHRRQPIYQAFFSQMPPSESSLIKQIGRERPIFHHLHDVLGLPITDVCLKEAGSSTAWLVIGMHKQSVDQPRRAIWGAWAADPTLGKFVVVVDDDIDPRDDFMVDWAISFRCQPHRDLHIEHNTLPIHLDPSVEDFAAPSYSMYTTMGSKLGIDATMKHRYPPKALPPREHLEAIDANWREYGFMDA